MTYTKIICISLFTCLVGIGLFLLHNQWIIIIPRPQAPQSASTPVKQVIPFFYPTETGLKKENQSLILSPEPTAALEQLVTEWLHFIYQEEIIKKKILLQSVALNANNSEAYISFDTTLFTKNQSTTSKLMLIEALLKTTEATFPSLQSLMLLSNNKPLSDAHLDFSYPWPITGYSESRVSQPAHQNNPTQMSLTILFAPYGDAQNKGRTIADSFERTIALQCAHLIKKSVMAENQDLTIQVLPTTRDMISTHQRATLANKKNIDLVISLNFYQELSAQSHCNIYYYVRNSATDFWKNKKNTLSLEPYDQAYKKSLNESHAIALHLKETVNSLSNSLVCNVVGIPYKPLVGIIKPAIALEIGTQNSSDLQTLVPILTQALLKVCTNP